MANAGQNARVRVELERFRQRIFVEPEGVAFTGGAFQTTALRVTGRHYTRSNRDDGPDTKP